MREIIIINNYSSSSSSLAVVIVCQSVIDRSLCSSCAPAHLRVVVLVQQSARCGREGVSHRHPFEHICSIPPPTAPGAGEGPRVERSAHLKVSLFSCSVSRHVGRDALVWCRSCSASAARISGRCFRISDTRKRVMMSGQNVYLSRLSYIYICVCVYLICRSLCAG